jgi:hypothetical protein
MHARCVSLYLSRYVSSLCMKAMEKIDVSSPSTKDKDGSPKPAA